MKTIGKHIIIKVDSTTKTSGGIILQADNSVQAVLVYDAEFMDLKAGTKIIFNPTIGFDFMHESETVRHITSDEVLAIIED